jgi:hypothetical protein
MFSDPPQLPRQALRRVDASKRRADRPSTLANRLAAFFEANAGVWLDGRELARVAGAYAWRSRISELRRAPFNMRIENRLRSVDEAGQRFRISEYRLLEGRETGSQEPR